MFELTMGAVLCGRGIATGGSNNEAERLRYSLRPSVSGGKVKTAQGIHI